MGFGDLPPRRFVEGKALGTMEPAMFYVAIDENQQYSIPSPATSFNLGTSKEDCNSSMVYLLTTFSSDAPTKGKKEKRLSAPEAVPTLGWSSR